MLRWILLCALSSLVCAPVFGQANVYNQLTRTAAETTDSADVWIPIWDQPATPRKSFKISVAELFKEPKAIVITSGSLADSSPAMDITQTWNDGTEAFTGWKLNVTSTASAAASKLFDLQLAGSSKVSVRKDGMLHVGTGGLYDYGSGQLGIGGPTASSIYVAEATLQVNNIPLSFGASLGASDLFLYRDAADILAQRNATTAQKLSVYNTYTDGSNYERGVIDWKGTSNTLRIGTEHAGTGVARAVSIVTGGTERMNIGSTGTVTYAASFSSPGAVITGSGGVVALKNNGGFITLGASDDVGVSRVGAAVLKVNDGSSGFGQLDAKRTTLTGGTITTASAPLVDATQTWNDAAVNFVGFKQNVTITAANTNSLLFDWQVGGTSYLKLTQYGDLVGAAFTGSDFSVRLQNGSLKQGSASITAWGSSNAAGSMDTALARSGAGIVKFTNASTGAGMIQLQEVGAEPSAPAADNVVIYAIDNGSGKTQLMAKFSSGAAQEIAIAP